MARTVFLECSGEENQVCLLIKNAEFADILKEQQIGNLELYGALQALCSAEFRPKIKAETLMRQGFLPHQKIRILVWISGRRTAVVLAHQRCLIVRKFQTLNFEASSDLL